MYMMYLRTPACCANSVELVSTVHACVRPGTCAPVTRYITS